MELKAALRNNCAGEGKKCMSARFTMDQFVRRRAQPCVRALVHQQTDEEQR
jgi:hypothetical protein